jgi:hypothetical protein
MSKGPTIIKDDVNSKRKTVSPIERILESHRVEKKMKGESGPLKASGEGEDEPSWIAEGIVVKIKDKELPKFYDQKGKIVKVLSDYVAEVQVLDSNTKIDIDQQFLETVIPVNKYL